LGTATTTGLLYQPRMIGDGDCREIDGMKTGRGNRSARRKPAPAPLRPPQIPHDWTCNCREGNRYSDWLRVGLARDLSLSPKKENKFLLSTSSRIVLGPTQSPMQWVQGVIPPAVKRLKRESDHSPPASGEVKGIWIYKYTSTPSYAYMA
jgi:hypothetical protein